jgi:hypothetical protein
MSEKPRKKSDVQSPLREPKPKTNKFGLGIKPNALKFPHDELIKPLVEETNESLTPTTPLHLLPPPTKQKTQTDKSFENYPISPAKDFQKVPNSVVRDALPQGLFKGTSKHTYDALFLRTRGAIVPTRTIKVRFNDLMNWTNISHNTLRNHLRHLEQVGLIKRDWQLGDNDGAIYEVFVPDELEASPLPPPTSYYPLPQPPPTSRQNLEYPSYQKLVEGGGGQIDENKDTSNVAKTFIKTKEEKRGDDEGATANPTFSIMIEKLELAVKKITGKNTSKHEAEKWGNLAELLILQLEIAASRTTEISSVPAFLTEVLRRKILKPTPQSSAKQSNLKKDIIGKRVDSFETDAEDRQGIKPLDENGREEALTMISEFADRDGILADFKQWFVEEDWNWLMEKLKK